MREGDTGSTGDGAGRQKTKPSINFLRWQVTSLNRRKVFSSSNLDGQQSPTLCSPQGPSRPSRGKGQGQHCPPEHPPVQRINFQSSMMPPNLYSILPVAGEVVDRHPRHLILTELRIGKGGSGASSHLILHPSQQTLLWRLILHMSSQFGTIIHRH